MTNISDDDLSGNSNDHLKNDRNDCNRPQGSWQSWNSDSLDRELDGALAQYAAVEPRPGLEERVLANLLAERKQAWARSWWQWGAAAAVAAMLLVTSTVLWRSGESRDHFAPQALNSKQDNGADGTRVTANGGRDLTPLSHPALPAKKAARIRRHSAAVVTASGPRLDQFPSPQPLSEQEKILERYVSRYPEYAALVAQARAEALRQDLAEEMKISAPSRDSEQ